MIDIKELYIIIVIYKIEYFKSLSYLSLVDSIHKLNVKLDLLIYDNSPDPTTTNSKDNNFNLTYIHDASNPGVSRAYNIGAGIAKNKEKKFLLLLDQDSKFDENFLDNIIIKINENPKKCLFAPYVMYGDTNTLISPSRYKNFRGSLLEFDFNKSQFNLKNMSMINSGMVISTDLFFKVGGYSESIRLDFSDHEFIHRISKEIDEVNMVPSKMYHSLSSMESSSLQSSIYRYNSYLEGGKIFSNNINKKLIFLYVSFGRCVLLSLKMKTFAFCTIFIKSLFK